jgi:CheY-like chemotaxis protein
VQQVVQAVNGREALSAVEASGGGDAFDVLLIDLHMPLMGGMEVWNNMSCDMSHT